MRASLPPTFAPLGISDAQKVGSTEWRSACPKCGGDRNSDRFVMWEQSRTTGAPMGWCRQCDYKWFPDGDKPRLTPEELEHFAELRREHAEREAAEIAKNRELFRQVPWWETYHHNLEHYPRAVNLWRERYGVTPWALQYYRLGYCPDFCYWHKDNECHSDTLTIPYFQPATKYQVNNLRHRLLDPAAQGGKYRPHKAGLGQTLFFANLNRQPDSLPFVLIVEGAIKAIVIWQTVIGAMLANAADTETEWFCQNVQVIAIPGTSLQVRNLPLLETAGRVYIAFDPDANERHAGKPSKAETLAADLGKPGAKVLHLPGKPDDLIIAGVMGINDLVYAMKNGRAA